MYENGVHTAVNHWPGLRRYTARILYVLTVYDRKDSVYSLLTAVYGPYRLFVINHLVDRLEQYEYISDNETE